MSLFSSEPLEADPATALLASPMSVSNQDTDHTGLEEPMDTSYDSLFGGPESSTPSTEQQERLLRILNDPSSNSQARLTFNVAHEMNSRKLWRFYLSEDEHAIFEAALTSIDTWKSFISLDEGFSDQYDDIKRQQQQQERQEPLPEIVESEPIPDITTADLNNMTPPELPDRSPDHIKQEVLDTDQGYFGLGTTTIKKEGSLSVRNSPSISTPPIVTPNGQLRTHHTPRIEGSPSVKTPRGSPSPNGPMKTDSSTHQAQRPSSAEVMPPPSIPTTAFRSRVMVFEQLLPALYPSHGGCCHPTVDVSVLKEKDISRYTKPSQPSISATDDGPLARKRILGEDDDYDVDMESAPKQIKDVNELPNKLAAGSSKDADSKKPVFSPDNAPLRLPIHHIYYTLEYDMDAMIEQQQLEEADKNIQEEQENQPGNSLVTDNMLTQLGAGSLSMKHLLGAIESNRAVTGLTDRELRTLLSDVRPNRSKWANEDRVGQEELYEGCERVLTELRNYTEHSIPFLNKVNKREAPDYFQVIKTPMDLGTVLKKLKSFSYQSKQQFADDLYLIYQNCMTYNSDPASVYRKHAIAMKKKTQQLLETVQDVTIRDRAEVEAEAEESDEETESQTGRPNEAAKGLGRKEQNSSKTVQGVNGEPNTSKSHAAQRGAHGSETPKITMDVDTMANATPTRETSREPSTMDSIETPLLQGGPFGHGRAGTPNGLTLHSPARHRMLRASVPVEIDLEQEEKDIAAELRASRGDVLFQEWKEKTKKVRAKILSVRESQQSLPFEDRFALERTPWEMKKSNDIDQAHDNVFDALTHRRRKKKKKRSGFRGRAASEAVAEESSDSYEDVYGESESDEEEEDEEDFARDLFAPPKIKEEDLDKKKTKKTAEIFLPEYSVRSGLPEVPGRGHERLDDPELARKLFDESEISALEEKQPSLSLYPSAIAAPGHLAAGIERNVEELRKIRHVYSKIFAAKSLHPDLAALEEPPEPAPIPPHEGPLPPLVMNDATGHAMVSQVASKLLAHAGFQGAQASALAVMTDITVEFFLNLGRTLRGYTDLYNKGMTAEEILLHTLHENGVNGVGDLEGYIREDVERYGNKLQDIHRKLETSYTDVVNATLNEGHNADADFEFQENDEAFTNGNFIGGGTDELGEDFFGFKELGIDREIGVARLSIPSRIWYGNQKDGGLYDRPGMAGFRGGVGVMPGKDPKPELPYPPPPPFVPMTDPVATIGLLHSFFKKRMEDLGALKEDEFMPVSRRVAMRPKIPPTGKIVSSLKKRSSKPGELSALAEAKKRKRKKEKDAQEAERAERKRQKQDAKDKKLMEKLEKKKMKEESKIKEKLTKPVKKGKKAASEGPQDGDDDDSDVDIKSDGRPSQTPDPMPPPATIPVPKASTSAAAATALPSPATVTPTPKKPKKAKAAAPKASTPATASSHLFVAPPTSILSSIDNDADDIEEEVMESGGGGNAGRMLPPKSVPSSHVKPDDHSKSNAAGKTVPGGYSSSNSSPLVPSSSFKSGVAGKSLPPVPTKSKSKSNKDGKDKDKDKEKDKEERKERIKDKDHDREKEKEKSRKERDRERERDKESSSERDHKDKDREPSLKSSSSYKESKSKSSKDKNGSSKDTKERGERERDNSDKEKDRDRGDRIERDRERDRSDRGDRERDSDRHRDHRERDREKGGGGKERDRERSRNRDSSSYRERERERDRDRGDRDRRDSLYHERNREREHDDRYRDRDRESRDRERDRERDRGDRGDRDRERSDRDRNRDRERDRERDRDRGDRSERGERGDRGDRDSRDRNREDRDGNGVSGSMSNNSSNGSLVGGGGGSGHHKNGSSGSSKDRDKFTSSSSSIKEKDKDKILDSGSSAVIPTTPKKKKRAAGPVDESPSHSPKKKKPVAPPSFTDL
ncbi:Transcriptional activator spt7 [Linnemannia exigua]|uniref:Transcriptional activator spt7 n=1 Tax=Linnemannia exigua TaxID=604196 RepID=A0AAD4DEG1_9FUNG|nr:Transcriptional activator spt7 [Linnemannia exigua]